MRTSDGLPSELSMENTHGVHKEGLLESPKHVSLFAKDNGMTIGSAHNICVAQQTIK